MKKYLETIALTISDSNRLAALEQGGIDNWDFYGDALNVYEEEHPDGINSLDVTAEDVADHYKDELNEDLFGRITDRMYTLAQEFGMLEPLAEQVSNELRLFLLGLLSNE